MGQCFNELAQRLYLLLSLGREDRGEKCQGSEEGSEREQGREQKKERKKKKDRKVRSREHQEAQLCACVFVYLLMS